MSVDRQEINPPIEDRRVKPIQVLVKKAGLKIDYWHVERGNRLVVSINNTRWSCYATKKSYTNIFHFGPLNLGTDCRGVICIGEGANQRRCVFVIPRERIENRSFSVPAKRREAQFHQGPKRRRNFWQFHNATKYLLPDSTVSKQVPAA